MYISVIEVLDGILKLVMAVGFLFVNYDKLVTYGWIMSAISMFNFVAFSLFCFIKYEECKFPKISLFDFKYIKEIFGFTGWIVYHSMCIVGRTQGLAIVLNKFFGTLLNAAYGVGLQVSGAINFVSSSLGNAINPQLVKSEGSDNRERVWHLARIQCKYSFLLLAAVSIPIMFEIDVLLNIWLKKVPEYSAFFAIMIMSAALFNQLTDGLGAAKQAIGNIKKYTLITSTPKLLVIPTSILFLYNKAPLYTVALCFVGAEVFSAVIRLPVLYKYNGFDVRKYYNQVVKMVILPVILCIAICYFIVNYIDIEYRFLLTFVSSAVLFVVAVYLFSMEKNEKKKINEIVLKIILKHKK